MDSLWIKNSGKLKKDFPVLDQDLDTEAVVIGGGIAGILTAYHLTKQGIKVVVLEGNTVGSGTTSHTTAKITACHGLIYDRLLHQVGKKLAGCHAIANQKAILAYRDLIDTEQIDCGFEMLPCYLYTTGDTTALEAEYKAAASFGLPVSMVTSTELPFPVTGAIRYEDQAQFHPLQFLCQLASHLNIYEHTMATRSKKIRYILLLDFRYMPDISLQLPIIRLKICPASILQECIRNAPMRWLYPAPPPYRACT